MRTAPMDHAKRVASSPTRAPDKHPATRPFIEAQNRRVSCCLRIGAHGPPEYNPARYPRAPSGIPIGNSAAAPRPCVFPLQFSPLETPFPESPFSRADSTKGGKPQGANARRPFWKTAQNRGTDAVFFSAVFRRRPTGGPAPPPLNQPHCARPRSWGQRVGRAETGCGRSGPRTVSALRGRRVRGDDLTAQDIARRVVVAFATPPVTRRASDPATIAPAEPSRWLLICPKKMRTLLVFAAGKEVGRQK